MFTLHQSFAIPVLTMVFTFIAYVGIFIVVRICHAYLQHFADCLYEARPYWCESDPNDCPHTHRDL